MRQVYSGMKSRMVVLALVVLCSPGWAQSVDSDSTNAEAWFYHAIQLHPDLADDHDVLVRSLGATAPAFVNMALIEDMRGNAAKSVEYFRLATQAAPNDPDAAFYYAMSLRNSDPEEYRKLAEAVVIRFPESDRGAQAIYRLAMDTPLLEDRIALLQHYYNPPPARAVLQSLPSVKELLFEAYTFKDLDRAGLIGGMYALLLVDARNKLRNATQYDALSANGLLDLIEAKYLPPRISHTPFYLMRAAARGGLAGYESLVQAMAKEPADILRDALAHYGEKLGKTPGQIQSDVRAALLAQAKAAPPLEWKGLDGAKVSLADYRGKVVLVNYWHPSCTACRAESPFLQQTLRRFGARQMAILSINVEPAEDAYVLPYIHGNGYYFTPLHGDGAAHDTPSSLLIDQDGRVVYERGLIRGAADQRELELQIEALLAQPNAGPLTAGDRVPDFAFIDRAGARHELHEYYGAEIVIDFCGACEAELTQVTVPTLRIGEPLATRLAAELFGMKLPAQVRIDPQGFFIAALRSN